ncbi:hypothetical protein [Rubinisphaera margarita]|uniref:hypothetical protein n=1 Tax=Rubinisphaera margarita TaxID=2909586 RepID=UPI001EE91D07|nr:hypothetical protein [Rubinisphaera margarita]MCG6158324.1 hypothetical protein [Rubinisphaera margarita]
MSQLTVKNKIHFQHGRCGTKKVARGAGREKPQGRLPRITKLMALAIRFDQLIRDGHITDYAELARLGHVSRARITQIMNLLNLAPEIQERLLFAERVESGPDPVTERELRDLLTSADWKFQQEQYSQIRQPQLG